MQSANRTNQTDNNMKKFLLSIFCLVIMAATSSAETYTHTFKEGQLTASGGTVTLSDIEWNTSSATSIGWNSNGKGVQIGSGSKPNASYLLSTSALSECKIKSITVNSSMANNGDAKLTITVGNQVSEVFTLGTADAAYTFDFNGAMGDITIKWEATAKAYYVSGISIEYTPDASMVTVPTPEFKTPAVIYADKVENVTVETTDQSAVIYYTTDGTDPSYEDYVNDLGTTKCSKYYAMYFNLTETTTIKAIAVKVDGDAVFKSGVAEQTYIVSRTMPYIPTQKITTGKRYALFAADSAATLFFGKENYGNLPTKTATNVNGKYIETVECAGFTFTAADGGYTIQDERGLYVYHTGTGTEFGFAAEKPAEGAVWSVNTDADGNTTIACNGYAIYYSTESATYGCYQTGNATDANILPKLYMQREYPTYTVTPVNNTELNKLETITVVCEEGIAATSDLVIKAEGKSTTFTIEQTDSKTLTFTASEPITTYNNMELNINITAGDIILNPGSMDMSLPVPTRYGLRTIVKYNLMGNAAAATIQKITPADGSTVETLSYVLFRFSYYPSASEDEALQPRLHAENSEEIIAVEFTTLKEDGSGHVHMMEAALKVVEPITTNGTYILEVPTGYFRDANGKDIKGVTLKYIVKNDTGIEEILGADVNSWTVYNVTGVKVLETTDAAKVKALPKGLYIINGIKSIVK